MATVLRLTVMTGPHKGEKFCFNGNARCLIGRSADCFVRLAGTCRDACISRQHCELVLEPTRLTMNDQHSQNGTYFNGTRITSLALGFASNPDDAALEGTPSLHHGDLLTIGGTTLRMDRVDCPPRHVSSADEPTWEPGESAKKGCPIQCI